ncbi:MAG: hypothetical protein JWL84_3086, partial [Rhodospirillales bacterium]|nr:hypothetical protein [Rhodospirillales bacterium]
MARPTRYPREWHWPNGAKIAVSVGLALEDFRYKSQVTTETAASKVNHFSLSFGDYGWKTGIWRLMDLMDEFDVKANMTVNGRAAERHPDVVAEVAKAGHEIAGHGWENDVLMSDDDPEAERREIQRCTKVLTDAAG